MKNILSCMSRYLFVCAVLATSVVHNKVKDELYPEAIQNKVCTPSDDICPEVAPVPPLGPNMCNLRADRVKVKETVDTCHLLVQGDAYVVGDLRVDGNICNGSEPIEGTEQEQGILIITSKQFRSADFADPLLLFPPLTSCQPNFMANPPVTVGFPIPADFDENAPTPIVIDVHFIGPVQMGMGTAIIGSDETVFTVTPFLRITPDGGTIMPLMAGTPSDIAFLPNRYQIEPAFVVLPAASGNLPGDLIQFALCIDGTLDPLEAPRLAALTVRYPKIDI